MTIIGNVGRYLGGVRQHVVQSVGVEPNRMPRRAPQDANGHTSAGVVKIRLTAPSSRR
jgi:hypothetical protein